jgi:hypothetical protein
VPVTYDNQRLLALIRFNAGDLIVWFVPITAGHDW